MYSCFMKHQLIASLRFVILCPALLDSNHCPKNEGGAGAKCWLPSFHMMLPPVVYEELKPFMLL